ncbi:TIGR03621 family F420-dependent LLM class oxidoreductase [Mycobacterium sp. URHB0021]|jgi:probable F420-dependent oxidoreductase
MAPRLPRFGIVLNARGSVGDVVDDARRAADVGFDTILITDHLGFISPLVPLAPIAAAVPSVRVGNCVLNSAFYRPALLSRDLTAVASVTGGRFEIGLGAGYVADEFAMAGLPFPTPGRRLRLLTQHVDTIKSAFAEHPSRSLQAPPIMIAGSGDRMLTMAAQKADIITIGALTTEADLAERVAYIKRQAGERFDEIELAFGFFQPSLDDPDDMRVIEMLAPEASDAQRRAMATVLDGSVTTAADRITRMRENLGITYFQFSLITDSMSTSWDTLEKLLIAARP